ncbi:TonB-dependent receptor [Solimonas flava]|uniref:TonB-dependent receptor n=1 Tax=Solimonas flava TaxID=415849 RepID=UPI000426CC0F|nr:TonB-dependent receptor [Solimonas flava]
MSRLPLPKLASTAPLAACLLPLLAQSPAFADSNADITDTTETAIPAPAAETASDDQLETVVVTAQKHRESLQQTPMSIAAFDSEKLKDLGITRATDLLGHVPNTSYKSFFGESQNPTFCFRSICLNVPYGDGIEPPVAMYTDEVYASSAFAQSLQFFDVQRIEVLKGPQGTLYGRNATGGLVNVIANKPTDTFQSSLSAEYGSFDNQVLEGFVSGPLGNAVRGRLAAQTHRRDGYVHGKVDGTDANDIDTAAFRGILDIDLAQNLSLELSGNYFKVDQGAQAYGLNGTIDPATGQTCSMSQQMSGNCVGIYALTDGAGNLNVSANSLYGHFDPKHWYGADIPGGLQPTNHIESFGGNATLDWQLDGWKLTSISAYSGGHKQIIEDLDGDIQYQYDDRLTADADTYTQELRGSGTWRGMDWILGGFLYDDSRDLTTELTPSTYYADHSTKDTRSYALYGNLDIPLVDTLKLVLGTRYSWEKVDVNFSRAGDYTSTKTDEKRHASSGDLDGKAILQWSPTDTAMAYASITTGHRSPNINSQSQYGRIDASSPLDALKPVKPEKLTSYELGSKLDLFDRRVRLNGSVFYYDFKDMQTSIYKTYTTSDGSTVGAGVLSNIDKVNVWGAELNLEALLMRGLTFNAGVGVTHSDIKTDEVDKDGNPLDGHELPFSNPTANAGLAYATAIGDYGVIKARTDYTWMADHYFSMRNDVTEEGKAYGLLGANVGWISPSETFQVDVFGSNLTDEKYFVYMQYLYDYTQQVVWGTPRTVGLRFTWNYR